MVPKGIAMIGNFVKVLKNLFAHAYFSVRGAAIKAYREDRQNPLRSMWKEEKLLIWFLAPLAILSFPVAVAHYAWCLFLLCQGETKDRANVIDAWHAGSLALWLAFLFVVGPQVATSSWRWILLLPLLRVADILYTMLVLVRALRTPREPARALVLAIVHYSEFVVIFACAYWAFFSAAPTGCIKKGDGAALVPLDFLYFSAVTASSVGYSSIFPLLSSECTMTRWLSMAEPIVLLLIIALLLPRAIARLLNIQIQRPPPS